MATSKTQRTLVLGLRQAKVSSLNLTTEKHGKERVPRIDVSLMFLLEQTDMAEVIDAKGNVLQSLWHKDGTPTLRDLKGSISLTTVMEGSATLGLTDEVTAEFEAAVFKAVKVTPLMKHQAECSCQVRVDPGDNIGLLEDLLVAEKGVFAFKGKDVPEDPQASSQENLSV